MPPKAPPAPPSLDLGLIVSWCLDAVTFQMEMLRLGQFTVIAVSSALGLF